MTNPKLIFTLVILLTSISALRAQEVDPQPERWALQLSLQHSDILFQEAFSIGQLGVTDVVRIRPVYSLEGQFFVTKGPKRKLFVSAKTGYYANLYHDRWLSAAVGIGFERRFFEKLIVSSRFEVGRSNISTTDPQYVYENEVWVPTDSNRENFGVSSFSPRIDIGYRVLTAPYTVDVIANYQVSLVGGSNVFFPPFYSTGIGVRVGL